MPVEQGRNGFGHTADSSHGRKLKAWTTQAPSMNAFHDDPILTRADIMERLQVSRETVRQWMKAGKLPKPDVALSRKTVGWKRSTLMAAGINL